MTWLDPARLVLMGELARALRRQNWPEAHRILLEAGLTSGQADAFLLEEYEAAQREGRRPVEAREDD